MWEKIDRMEQDMFLKCKKGAREKKKNKNKKKQTNKQTCPGRETSTQWGVNELDEKIRERNKQIP